MQQPCFPQSVVSDFREWVSPPSSKMAKREGGGGGEGGGKWQCPDAIGTLRCGGGVRIKNTRERGGVERNGTGRGLFLSSSLSLSLSSFAQFFFSSKNCSFIPICLRDTDDLTLREYSAETRPSSRALQNVQHVGQRLLHGMTQRPEQRRTSFDCRCRFSSFFVLLSLGLVFGSSHEYDDQPLHSFNSKFLGLAPSQRHSAFRNIVTWCSSRRSPTTIRRIRGALQGGTYSVPDPLDPFSRRQRPFGRPEDRPRRVLSEVRSIVPVFIVVNLFFQPRHGPQHVFGSRGRIPKTPTTATRGSRWTRSRRSGSRR